ncbi:hypothetical protein PCE1_000727 [Barthelona sp. PCE]
MDVEVFSHFELPGHLRSHLNTELDGMGVAKMQRTLQHFSSRVSYNHECILRAKNLFTSEHERVEHEQRENTQLIVLPITFVLRSTEKIQEGIIHSCDINPTNTLMSAGGVDGLSVLNMSGKKHFFRSFTSPVRDCSFCPEYNYIIASLESSRSQLIDLETQHTTQTFTGHAGSVYCNAVHPTLPLFFSGGRDGAVCAFDLRQGKPTQRLYSARCPVLSLAASLFYVVAGDQDGNVHHFDLRSPNKPIVDTSGVRPIRKIISASHTSFSVIDSQKIRQYYRGNEYRSKDLPNSVVTGCYNTEDGSTMLFNLKEGIRLDSDLEIDGSYHMGANACVFDKTCERLFLFDRKGTLRVYE